MDDTIPLDADIGDDWHSRSGESPREWDKRTRLMLMTAEQRRAEELADEWREKEAVALAALDDLLLSGDVTDFLVNEIPYRASQRARAMHVLMILRADGYIVEYRDCDIRVNPPPTEPLARAVYELAGPMSDLLQEGF